ncbi:beta-ribofuranosylaminobenzene 5'-phosphate synthase family protein [Halocatena salina]|uniref:Beta-ribofuranosylaminobenzene 5'-phosphate synthase n=1 Tax=Halocatena salina TaxID=2934340 RepID=A0A8U0A0M9_9EURY|nr:beta-ribofuranosylaminobenzene 5'-phosphate synthase family protein [Halocatena salina]UPM42632.1 GHMP kinase [Halocatena salina]
MATVRTGARLHIGFQNLSLAHERLYGGVGVALEEPRVVLEAHPADTIDTDPVVQTATERAVSLLGVSGARVRLRRALPRHVGLGSGTQHALATFAAIARAYDIDASVREHAPALGRGGRSGVGVGTFETGGFVVDAGHPTELFTTAPPEPGEWTVPSILARHSLPADWRFVLVIPTGITGEHGEREDRQMRSVVERADPTIGEELAVVLTHQLLPAVADGNIEQFGHAIEAVGRLNGAWYADEQGGVYRPPAGDLIERLRDESAVAGVGQSSWGPVVYGLADVDQIDAARTAATDALAAIDNDGEVLVSEPRNHGVRYD